MQEETNERKPNEPIRKEPTKKEPKGFEALSMLGDLVAMLAIVTVIFVFFFRLVGVKGSSMYPTFMDQDFLVLQSNVICGEYQNGDIVVMSVPAFENQGPIVKRVIATGGQTVDIDFNEGVVYVDGSALEERYVFAPTFESYQQYGMGLEYPVTVPEGSLFVMGDNRNNSADSRYAPVGCVETSRVLGKVLLVIFPGRQTDEMGNLMGGRSLGRIGAVS